MNADGSLQSPQDNSPGRAGGLRDDEVIKLMKERFEIATRATSETVKDALDDLQFLKGRQWPEQQARQRESDGRPVLTVNKLPTFLHQVTNDQRQNKASIKISAVNENADSKVAELVQGMVRHIEYDSAADTAYDTAINSAAAIGFGYFRFITEFERPDTFDQVIKVKRIRNPFTVYVDPDAQEIDGSDMKWVIISGKMKKTEFRAKFPKAQATLQAFDTLRPGDKTIQEWVTADDVRTAEYYFKHYEMVKIYLLSDGRTVQKLAPGETAIRSRMAEFCRIFHYICSPIEVLEKTEILAPAIPVFPVYGAEIDVDGRVYRVGVIRNAKDPAMMYNFWMTSATEEIAMRPKTPYIGAKGQFVGEEKKWSQANVRSYAYLEYEPVALDGHLSPAPQRQPMADIPSGYLTMAMHASDNIKATTGIFDSSLGNAGNATSGKQEIAQQRQGSTANYHFTDNFFKTLRHAGKVLIDMIPKYYDTERIVMTRGEDLDTKGVKINEYIAAADKFVNDIRTTKFQSAVTVGPSYATMRAEAADAMVQFGQSWPKLMDIAGDKVVKAMNWPGADDIAKRIARTIPPAIMGDENGEQEMPQAAQQKIAELEEQLKSLQEKADDNTAAVTIAQIRKEAITEAAKTAADSRKDVEEIKGWVKLLVEKQQPPAEFTTQSVTSAPVAPTRAPSQPPGQPEDLDQNSALMAPQSQNMGEMPGMA